MKALITGGGTGGHINPAIAIANAIKAHEPDSEILFVGTSRGMENKLVPAAGYPLTHIEIRGLKRKLTLDNLKTLWLTVTSVSKAKKLIKSFHPDIVIGTGGYVCWPVCKAASAMGIPTVLHESNAIPGVAVKMLAPGVDRIYTNFEKTAEHIKQKSKIMRVGNPLRNEFQVLSRKDARTALKVPQNAIYLLSCGGSLGAKRINQEILNLMKNYSSKNPNLIHVHATGAGGYEDFMKTFREAGLERFPNLCPMEYIYDMPLRLNAADIVINRAGAMTLSELAALGKASILIPSPNVTDDHQYKNAAAVAEANGAILIRESELENGVLENAVRDLIEHPEKRAAISEAFRTFATENAADSIYNDMKGLVISKKS